MKETARLMTALALAVVSLSLASAQELRGRASDFGSRIERALNRMSGPLFGLESTLAAPRG